MYPPKGANIKHFIRGGKNMRKAASFLLTATLILTAGGTTVLAAGGNADLAQGNQSIDVEARYESSAVTPTVYSVDVSWGAMQFTYSESGTLDWDPDSHTYSDNTEAGWTSEGNTVAVTNHSNTQVTVSFSYDSLEDYAEVSGSFDKASFVLPSAENRNLDDGELKEQASLLLEGTLDERNTEFARVGTITVTIE